MLIKELKVKIKRNNDDGNDYPKNYLAFSPESNGICTKRTSF